jgi:hypothetical protein
VEENQNRCRYISKNKLIEIKKIEKMYILKNKLIKTNKNRKDVHFEK